MTKEQLRKEFDELDRYSSNITWILNNKFDWFYSKLEEKDKELNYLRGLKIVSEMSVNHLEAKLKAADEVIERLHIGINYHGGNNPDLTDQEILIYDVEGTIKALEHYKSLKP